MMKVKKNDEECSHACLFTRIPVSWHVTWHWGCLEVRFRAKRAPLSASIRENSTSQPRTSPWLSRNARTSGAMHRRIVACIPRKASEKSPARSYMMQSPVSLPYLERGFFDAFLRPGRDQYSVPDFVHSFAQPNAKILSGVVKAGTTKRVQKLVQTTNYATTHRIVTFFTVFLQPGNSAQAQTARTSPLSAFSYNPLSKISMVCSLNSPCA